MSKINILRDIGWDFYYSIYLKSDKSYFEFSSLNQATKREFWFASKEFVDSF